VSAEPREEYLWDEPVLLTRNNAYRVSHDALEWLDEHIALTMLPGTLAEIGRPLRARSRAVCLPADEQPMFVRWLGHVVGLVGTAAHDEQPFPELRRLYLALLREAGPA
jgi:hypothetical protein